MALDFVRTEATAWVKRCCVHLLKKHGGVVLVILVALVVAYMLYKHWARVSGFFGLGTGSPDCGGTTIASPAAEVQNLKQSVNLGSADCPTRYEVKGTYLAKFVSCYDGDTCDVVLLMPRRSGHGHKLMRFRARTMGYNAPEMRQPLDAPNREEDKRLAVESRERLWKLLTGNASTSESRHDRLVVVDAKGFDKYGRLLVIVYDAHVDGRGNVHYSRTKSVNDAMLEWLGPRYAMDDKGRMVHRTD
jgi:endonuclease YncB( thermonuclease family)